MKADEIIEKIITNLHKDSQAIVKLDNGTSVVIETDISEGISAYFYRNGKYFSDYDLAQALRMVMCNPQDVVEVV